ncbi:DUF802 domain-containing protein [Cupriavidus necator]|uniref:DUF802 domain-containing protein n=1 Tax=Cupriavidus necator TaxID=106590 RepID=UPI0005B334E7|nr:DUF802 domain-containing protein [Cupriavidus necator]
MTRYLIHIVAFLAGLAVVGWIGASYAGSNALALVVTLLIGGCYLAGAFELQRYRQATTTLSQALSGLSEAPANLANWLERLHPSLRDAVRLRIEGDRVALPGPALTPYLVGLLVLLGMLGTFLGMVATLRGTGLALESATDLQAIRASMAAPVKGLGFAFGTSVAGVATSAMLGLLAALCRRERIQAAQSLDARIATALRPYSRGHQREEAFRLLQRQADAMPVLVDRLQAMMTAMEQQNLALTDRLAASQDAFHGKTEVVYTRLASSVEQSLKDSIADSARAASAAIQPAVDATMAGLAQETASLRETVTQAVQQHLDGVSTRFETTTTNVAEIWSQALAGQQRASEAIAKDLRTTLDGFAQTFDQRSAGLLDGVATRVDAAAASAAAAWTEALGKQERASEKLAGDNQQALASATAAFAQQSAALVQAVDQSHASLQAQLAVRDEQRLAAWTEALGAMAASLRQEWQQASAHAATRQQEICETLAKTANDIAAQAQTHASSTLAEIDRLVQAAAEAPKAVAAMQAELAAKDEQRLTAWTSSLGAMASALRTEWEQAGAHTASRQQEICAALAQTARDISTQTQAHASSTIAEIGRLVQVAAEAPKAAAVLQAELAAQDQQRLAAWTESLGAMASALRTEWEQAGAHTASRQQEICAALAQTARDISTQAQAHASSTIAEIDRLVQVAAEAPEAAAAMQAELAAKDEQRLTAWTGSLAAMAASLRQEWEQAGTSTASRQQQICEALAQTARDISTQTQAHASSTIAEIDRLVQAAAEAPKAAAAMQAELAAKDEQRLSAWTGSLAAMAASLRQEWEQADAHTASRQQEICDTLAQTARDISTQTQAHASSTIAEVSRLVQAATEAPKAAAEVIAELRQKLTDGMARDNAMLEERSRMLGTLGTLLDAVNHASTEQRTAVDKLVGTTADLLDRVGTRFTDKVESEADKLAAVAAQVTGSAVEVASLGEAFGVAVQLFSDSNDKLMGHLQRIEAALDKSMARSDEQLAYYVAQAREVVDLSMMSQKQILEDLQQLGGQGASRAEAA